MRPCGVWGEPVARRFRDHGPVKDPTSRGSSLASRRPPSASTGASSHWDALRDRATLVVSLMTCSGRGEDWLCTKIAFFRFSCRFSSQLLLVPWTRPVGRTVAGLQFPSSGACLQHAQEFLSGFRRPPHVGSYQPGRDVSMVEVSMESFCLAEPGFPCVSSSCSVQLLGDVPECPVTVVGNSVVQCHGDEAVAEGTPTSFLRPGVRLRLRLVLGGPAPGVPGPC